MSLPTITLPRTNCRLSWSNFFQHILNGIVYCFIRIILPGLLAIPFLYIGYHKGHAWGDDYAQYIMQAQNIAHGHLTSYTWYIPNYNNLEYAPAAYPVGFPLLLGFFISVTNDSINTLVLWMLGVSLIFVVLMYNYIRAHSDIYAAVVLTTVACCSTLFISFKSQVLSDIPFSIFFILTIWSYENRHKHWVFWAVTTLFLCVSMLFRTTGIALLAGIIMCEIIPVAKSGFKDSEVNAQAFKRMGWIGAALGLYFIIQNILNDYPFVETSFFRVLVNNSIKISYNLYYASTLCSVGVILIYEFIRFQ